MCDEFQNYTLELPSYVSSPESEASKISKHVYINIASTNQINIHYMGKVSAQIMHVKIHVIIIDYFSFGFSSSFIYLNHRLFSVVVFCCFLGYFFTFLILKNRVKNFSRH